MEVILILTGALLAVGLPLWWVDRRHAERENASDSRPEESETGVASSLSKSAGDDGECCGQHTTCERDSLLAAVSREVEYYDDEELDRFKGRTPDSYTDMEVEEFRDVLLTLLPDDIAGWARSIQLRGITLPPEVRDELIMIVGESRRIKTISETHA